MCGADKTGTLTQNKLTLGEVLTAGPDLCPVTAALLGRNLAGYSPGAMSYDLRRLRSMPSSAACGTRRCAARSLPTAYDVPHSGSPRSTVACDARSSRLA
jgi:magnesium-transporting ATPase (P-type)